MKSLLQTLPSAQTVELWGAQVRTNLEIVLAYSTSSKKRDRLVIPLVLGVFMEVERFDFSVASGSVFLRGRRLNFWASPGKGFISEYARCTGDKSSPGSSPVVQMQFLRKNSPRKWRATQPSRERLSHKGSR